MPFCTECGARHDESARTCPKCGEPIAEPPDEDLDDILADLGTDLESRGQSESLEGSPVLTAAEPDYLEQIEDVRGSIAAQSGALQGLDDLSWSNPEAKQIYEELSAARNKLRVLAPPEDLGQAHTDFLRGAELLVEGFRSLVDAAEAPDPRAAEEEAQAAIAEATEQFRSGADALHTYLTQSNADLDAELAALGIDELSEPMRIEDDALPLPNFPTTPEVAPEPDDELPDMPLDLEEMELPEPGPADAPIAMPDLGPAPPVMPPPGPPPARVPYESEPSAEALAGAWPGLGDPATDRLLLEIEGGWVRGRPQVHDAIERAVRAAVADALRNAFESRQKMELEARATLTRLGAERNRLSGEVESLRRDALALQSELAELRRSLNELERDRQIAQERRQQMFQEAEAQRSGLLREIEQLGGQLDTMRRTIVSLLNASAGTAQDGASAFGDPTGPMPGLASGDDDMTEVRITGVGGALKNMQLQRALKDLTDVALEGQPQFQDGVLSVTLRHPRGYDVTDALAALPGAGLSFEGMPEPGVLVFVAA